MKQQEILIVGGSNLPAGLLLKLAAEQALRSTIQDDSREEVAVACYDDIDLGQNSDCKTDHGERTNYKLQDQPFYMRGRNGKMRGY